MAAKAWLDAPPAPKSSEKHWDCWDEECAEDLTGAEPSASSAEPSTGRLTVQASQNEFHVPPLDVPYEASQTSRIQAGRPRHEWVQKTSERLGEQGGAGRAAHGPGGRVWAAEAGAYDRRAKHAPTKHREIEGVEALGEGVTAAVAKELGAAKTALGITAPAVSPERFTMVVMGRPVQAFSASTMCLPCRAFRRQFLFIVHLVCFQIHRAFVFLHV